LNHSRRSTRLEVNTTSKPAVSELFARVFGVRDQIQDDNSIFLIGTKRVLIRNLISRQSGI
jgi:hypothetical protein